MLKKIRKVIYFIFKWLPIKKKIIFESQLDYFDNSKALFEKMIELELYKNYEFYWILEKDGMVCCPEHSKSIDIYKSNNIFKLFINEIKLSYHLNSAEYIFFSYLNFVRLIPKENQNVINLTHGTSLKDTRGKYIDVRYSTNVITLSEFASNLRSKSLLGGRSKMISLGFPRNDLLFNTDKQAILNSFNIDLNDYTKIIMWMPTFRRSKLRNDNNTNLKHDLPIFKDKSELEFLEKKIEENKILLIIKPHPGQDLNYFPAFKNEHILVLTNSDFEDKNIELYEFLSITDSLITDYSSVYIDYLLTEKPIGFTIDDLEDYKNGLGFLIDNPKNYMPGQMIKTSSDFIDFIEDLNNDNDNYKDEREKMLNLFHNQKDGKSSERILKYFNLIKENK